MQWLDSKWLEGLVVLILVILLLVAVGTLGWSFWYTGIVSPLDQNCDKWSKASGAIYYEYDYKSDLCIAVLQNGDTKSTKIEESLNRAYLKN